MHFQPASRPQTVLKSHESPSLASIQLLEPALDEEQELSLEFLVFSQATESCYSSNASHEVSLLASKHPPELALENEQESSPEPVVQKTAQSKLSSSSSYEVPLLASNQSLKLVLNEEQESGRVSQTCPFIYSSNGCQLRALKNTRGELFSSVPKECARPKTIEGQRGRAIMRARGHGKTVSFLLLLLLSIFGVAQALTDCQILNEWLPKKFNEASCCEQLELKNVIKCVSGRITHM
jgi:hypothetical protein